MNRIYKTLFSIRTGQLVIASENKSNHRKVTVDGCKPEPQKIPSLHFQPHHDGTRAGLVRTVSKLSIATAVACAMGWSGAAWAVTGTDGSGASTSNVTQGSGTNIASGGGSSAGVMGDPYGYSNGSPDGYGGSYNTAIGGGQAGNGSNRPYTYGGNGGNYNQAFGDNSSAGNANGTTDGTSGNIAIGSSSS
ncbi:hypothetical protein HAP94_23100, partial [Acidithiobacillus ferrivorans]|nr:hypothetical protein [Acidithiobacillus ferrivorans]